MKSVFRLVLLSLSGLLITGCSGSTPPVSSPQEVQSPGEALFMANCSGCHGGGGNALVPEKPLQGSSKLASLPAFSQFIRKPSGNMPAFAADQISEAQMAELYQYVLKNYP